MAGFGPGILVVATDRDERALMVAALREAGFAVASAEEATDAGTALGWERAAAAVIALPGSDGVALMRAVRRRNPGLPVLLVAPPSAAPPIDDENCRVLGARAIDPRRMLDAVFELVLHDDGREADTAASEDAAEFGIAAAKLSCLYSRLADAAQSGANRLMQDLTRQIGELTLQGRLTNAPPLAAAA
jgi:DNA-binding NtrC family response regulator